MRAQLEEQWYLNSEMYRILVENPVPYSGAKTYEETIEYLELISGNK